MASAASKNNEIVAFATRLEQLAIQENIIQRADLL